MLWVVAAEAVTIVALVAVIAFAGVLTPASSASPQAPAPSKPGPPAPGTYWYNTSFSGQASELGGACVTDNTCNEYVPAWIDFNVSCPTGNMNLTGGWSNTIPGWPAYVEIISGGSIIATSGGFVPWYGTVNASSGTFAVTAHQLVEFEVFSFGAGQFSQTISISGEQHSWSVIL